MTDEGAEQYRRIQAKEQELRDRERALSKAHVHVQDEDVKNWPPCHPLLHHDIVRDIPMVAQWTVRLSLFGQYAFYITLLWNIVGACCTGIEGTDLDLGPNIVFAILIAVLGIPCGFKINYMRLYDQARRNRIAITFFAIQGLLVAAVGLVLVGIQNWGCMGIMTALDAVSAEHASGFQKFAIGIAAVFWGICVAWQLFLFGKIVLLFKVTGVQPGEGQSV
jgi:hypothetical protein